MMVCLTSEPVKRQTPPCIAMLKVQIGVDITLIMLDTLHLKI